MENMNQEKAVLTEEIMVNEVNQKVKEEPDIKENDTEEVIEDQVSQEVEENLGTTTVELEESGKEEPAAVELEEKEEEEPAVVEPEENGTSDSVVPSSSQAFDLNNFMSSSSYGTSGRKGEAGALSLVNSNKNGKRLTISKDCWGHLDNAENVQISFSDSQIAIAKELPGNENFFNVKPYGTKGVIYSKNLVHEITDLFELDFSNKVSITFYDVDYVNTGEHTVVIITVN
jgi:hypothetical protein